MSVDTELEATLARIRRVQAEVEETSDRTATVISRQSDDLAAIAASAETVERNTSVSGRIIRGLESWTGRFKNFLEQSSKSKSAARQASAESPLGEASTVKQEKALVCSESFTVDDSLDAISASLGRMKSKSLAISEDIRRQDVTLESTSERVVRSVSALKDHHKRISR